MRAAVVLLALLATSAASDFFLCEVVVPNFCATPVDLKRQTSCASNPALTLQGNSYDITTGYNVIAFGDLNAVADTQGRMLVGGDTVLSTGYSVGELIYTAGPGAVDVRHLYSAVFGGSVNWPSGSLNPSGNNFYSAAYNEDMYVAGTFTGADDLKLRRTTNTESISESMMAAKDFYTKVQLALDAVLDNIAYTVTESNTMMFTCAEGLTNYAIHVPSSAFASVTSYSFSGCASTVQMVITIPDDSTSVSFTSGAISPADRQASRTVFNIMGSDRTITFSSVRFYGIILAPLNNYAVNANAPGATDGIVIVNDVLSAGQFNRINCTRPAVVGEPTPCVTFETTCAGTLFAAPASSIQGDTRDYNVISFDSFVANTGDIEGRLMVRNNFVAGDGYSIGYELQTANNLKDRQEAYSLLAGGDCVWGDGSVHPDGTNKPYAGRSESIFCGKSFTGPSSLSARKVDGCSVEGCLNSVFDAAYTCYSGYASTLAAQSTNVKVTVADSALIFTCASSTATNYVVEVDAAQFPQATYYVTNNCNFQAYWTINVVGSGDVLLSGDSMPAPAGAVVYNIVGERTIYVSSTSVNGHILAPQATLNQTGGVIRGKVVIGNVISSLQINREDTCTEVTTVKITITSPPKGVTPNTDIICPEDPTSNGPSSPNTPSTANTPTTPGSTPSTPGSTPTPSDSDTVDGPGLLSYNAIPLTQNATLVGDIFNGNTIRAVDTNGCLLLNQPTYNTQTVAGNQKIGYVAVPSNAGGKIQTVQASQQTSSASVAALSMVVFVVALLF